MKNRRNSNVLLGFGCKNSKAGSDVSQDELRSALTSLFEENGAEFNALEQAFGNNLGAAGSFLDQLA